MRRSLFLLLMPVVLPACFTIPARADDAPRVVNVFYAPLLMDAAWKKGDDAGMKDADYPQPKKGAATAKKDTKDPYPAWPNRFADCIPGKFFDLRSFFSNDVKLADGDMVLFNPASKLCVVSSSAANVDVLEQVIETYNPTPDVIVEGSVSVGADADGKTPDADLASWRISGKSGQTVKSSTGEDKGISYEWQGLSVVPADGKSVDFTQIFKVVYEGIEYGPKASPDGAPPPGIKIIPGRMETIKLGETPEGAKAVYLHITAKVKLAAPVSPVADPDAKKKMVECIKKHLAEPAKTS